jgi:hypothetical protein
MSQNEDGEMQDVAVKMPKEAVSPEVTRAFRKEISLMLSIGSHPYIVRCVIGDSSPLFSPMQHAQVQCP